MWAALGIVSANVVWFTLSAVGLGAALVAMGDRFLAVQWIVAALPTQAAMRRKRQRKKSRRGKIAPPGKK